MILIAGLLGGIALYAFWVNEESFRMDTSQVFMLTIYFLIFLPKMLWNILKPKPILILSANGIHSLYGGSLPNAIVSWDYFEFFRPMETQGVPYIELRLKNEESFAIEFPDFHKKVKKMRKTWNLPTGLFPTVYNIKPEKLLTLLGQWLPQNKI